MTSTAPTDDAEVLDAREVSGEPFGPIMSALDDLDRDETLLLINSFEPVPLYDVLEDRGCQYTATKEAEDEWHIEITRA